MNRILVSLLAGLVCGALIVEAPACGLSLAAAQQDATVIQNFACVAAEVAAALIPPGAVEVAAADIALVCPNIPVPSIVQFIANLLARQADAGVAAASEYKPSPKVLAAKADRARK
jgi:hypothetical protein